MASDIKLVFINLRLKFLQLCFSRLLVLAVRIFQVRRLYVVQSLDGCEPAMNSVKGG